MKTGCKNLILSLSAAALVALGASPTRAQNNPPPTSAAHPPPIPDTPAGRQLGSWLAATSSGDPKRLDAFLRAEFPSQLVAPGSSATFMGLTGGIELVRINSASDGQIVALVRERAWDRQFANLTITVEAQPGEKISALRLLPGDAPADWPPVARLSEAEAIEVLKTRLEEIARVGGPIAFSGAVRIARNGEVVFDYVTGVADRANRIANTLDTRFRIGSMNKMFTAVSILQLAEAGKIDLNAPIGAYLSDYPNKDLAARVTIRHLLTHTGGTGDIFGPQFLERRSTLCETRDYIALYGARDVDYAPDEKYAYSNYGFVLLGAIVEAVTGRNYHDYVAEHIYAPARMAASGSLPETVQVVGRAVGYTTTGPADPELRPNTDTLPCRGSPAGGGYATVGDLIRFADTLRAGKLLGPELLKSATTQQVTSGRNGGYGYGFSTTVVNGARAYGHGGSAPGMGAELMVFPDSGYVVALATNVDTPLVNRIVQFIGARLPATDNAPVTQIDLR